MNNRYDVNGVEETWAVAKAFAAELKPGDVVCLEGAFSCSLEEGNLGAECYSAGHSVAFVSSVAAPWAPTLQRSPTFLAPGTSLVEDNFSMN